MSTTSIVTGGAGFIGSHVVDELLKMHHKVIVIDDLSGGFEKNINNDAVFIRGSVTNTKLVEQVFLDNKIDYVFHLAAYAAEGLSHFIRKFNYENNLIGSINLINQSAKHGIKKFIFTSSIAVYGSNQTPMTEDLTPSPEDPYGIAKYAVELDLKAAFHMFGLKYTIFRPHNVYGERQNHGDPYRNVLGIFINNTMKDKPLTIFGDGKQTRAFSHISDVAPYIARSAELKQTENEVINIGADKPYAVIDLANQIGVAMNKKVSIVHLPPRKEVVHAYADHSKFKKIFKPTKTIPLAEGIKKMVDWSLRVGPLKGKKFKNIELEKNMPASWKKFT